MSNGQLGAARTIYKIVSSEVWRQAVAARAFRGAPVDTEDGFIHFSAAHQVGETAKKHFLDQNDLVLLAVDTSALGNALRWEPSRGGALFPHLYGELDLAAILSVQSLPDDRAARDRFLITLVEAP